MPSIIKGFNESQSVEPIEVLDVNWHNEDSERFEFHSTSKNQETGYYDTVMTVDDLVVAEKPGDPDGVWVMKREQMGYLMEDWDELSTQEQMEQMETIEELIPRIYAAHFGRTKVADTNVERVPKELSPCGDLGEVCEAKSQAKEWEDKLFIIEGFMDGFTGKQTFGIQFYKPPGNKDGGFLNLFRKRKGLPESYVKKWEPVKIKVAGENPSSAVAMKNYNGEWNWRPSVHQFFEDKSDGENGELTFEQICSEYPNNIMIKLFNFAK